MKRNRKAKILATLGPASSDKKIIEDLFVAGCDVFRLNFSHGDLETHRKNYENIRSLEEKHNHASCILADLQGPKLRVGTFKNTKENLVKGQSFVLDLSLIHISEPTRHHPISYAVFCLLHKGKCNPINSHIYCFHKIRFIFFCKGIYRKNNIRNIDTFIV